MTRNPNALGESRERLQSCLDAARKAHADARYGEALGLYQILIASDPTNGPLLSVAGLAALQAGESARAREWLTRAARHCPRDAAIHANLAGAHLAVGDALAARAALRHAIDLQPLDARLVMNLGQVEERLDAHEPAIAAYHAATRLAPGDPAPWDALGRLHHSRSAWREAAEAFGEARRLRPDDPPTLLNHAAALEQAGALVEAATALSEAAVLAPDDARVQHRLGAIRLQLEDYLGALAPLEAAANLLQVDADLWLKLAIARSRTGAPAAAHAAIDRAVAIAPTRGDLFLARGNLHWDADEHARAAEAYARATELTPDRPEIWFNRGNAAKALGDLALAETCFIEAVRLDPENATNHCQLSHHYLSTGQWRDGFAEAEWRWRLPTTQRGERVAPDWQGEPLTDKRIVVRAEQGYGDTIQFVRMTRDLGAVTTFLEVQTPLVRLLRSLPWPITVLEPGTPMPELDYEIAMMSLPSVIGFDPERVAEAVPYLTAPADAVERWRQRLRAVRGMRVGLAVKGNPDYLADRHRSIPLDLLNRLRMVEGVDWIPVQPDAEMPEFARAHDHTMHLTDFAETAALLANLDLVVTVDTAVAHLAGALGRPVWMLNRHDGDWRWLRAREDTIWYPSMRLFRQPCQGDWQSVLIAVAEALGRESARSRRR